MLARQSPPALSAAQLHALARESLPEFLDIVGLGGARRSRPLWAWLFRPAAARFVRQIATYDRIVGTHGLQQGAVWLVDQFATRLDVVGRGTVPTSGPLLIVANHPGLTDAAALLASLPRPDVYVVAVDCPFLRALPHTSEHLVYVPAHGYARARVLPMVTSHLERGHAVVIFPAGRLEPDPLVQAGSVGSLRTWSRSIGVLLERSPDAQMVAAVVGGVRSADALAHPLTRLRREAPDRQRLADLLQTLVPVYRGLRVRLVFGPPIAAESLLATHGSALAITRAIAEQMRHLMQSLPTTRSPLVDQQRPTRRTTQVRPI